MTKPQLSIGIIFRNDIRSIERCLKALQPLRDALSCELVMADTGSNDGSREVAEKYADILFDFPWINDFSAARNAVIDRCSADWYLSVDTDEYLTEGVGQIEEFLLEKGNEAKGGTVIIRNFFNYELTGNYTDFLALRLVKVSLGVRYSGAIHEGWDFGEGESQILPLTDVIFDHDGYVGFDRGTEKGAKKIERNLELLREEVRKNPNSILRRLQLVESCTKEPDYVDQIRQAVEVLKKKPQLWEKVGPPLIRYALFAADERGLTEWDEWLRLAREWFPDSMYIRLDGEWAQFNHAWRNKDYSACVACGERYMKAMEDFRAGADPAARMVSTLQMATPFQEQRVKIYLAAAYRNWENNFERALELLSNLDYSLTFDQQTIDILVNLHEIHFRSELDTSSIIQDVWNGTIAPEPSQKQANQRRQAFIRMASSSFILSNRELERAHEQFHRYAYTLYTPLYKSCDIGLAARIMEASETLLIDELLGKVENWNLFPIQALAHAFECGVYFPLRGKTLNMEELDSLAARLAQGGDSFFPLVEQQIAEKSVSDDLQSLCWMRALLMAAVRAYPWTDKERDEEQGMAIARAFAKNEGDFLPLCYNADSLREDRIFMLPPLHRFGWYCARAFDALKKGDTAEYVRLLRAGLAVCETVNELVEFLLEHTPELQAPTPSAELQALAEQIRTILAGFAPDDPAVAALKQSEAYQKVAYFIEGASVPVVGGLLQ